MRSIRGSLNQLQPLIYVSVGAPGATGDRESCYGLIDTGATRTCITQRLVARFGLRPVTKMLVSTAGSFPERRPAYEFSLGLFCMVERAGATETTLYVPDLPWVAPSFQDNANFDVLIGMDLLSRGRLGFEPDGSFRFDFEF